MILEELAAAARQRIREQKEKIPSSAMRRMAEEMGADTGFPFYQAIRKPGLSFICEVKKASPSKGVIAEDFPYLKIAEEYEEAGAAALSVLTEPTRFLGQDKYLEEIAQKVKLPVLRKDFTIDEYMIDQARVMGASAVLLICSLLSAGQLKEYLEKARSLGLSALVEAHTENEVEMGLLAGAQIIGVNNRNLKDFTVDIENSVRLRPMVPPSVCFISESGIRTGADLKRLYENGTDGVLIGEAFMRAADKKALLNEFREGKR